ncbi:MAG TPA: chemotaxis protein CheW [Caulobacteraceae bacterium]|nr:chemotaxis protein CheW [Caulobacteraceae bacterium]
MSESANEAQRELISFRVGEQFFCVDIMAVREIRGWSPPTPLPQSPLFVTGVINLRGQVLPIVDMAARLGLPPAEATARHVIIVVSIAGRLVGVLVDAVCDIVAVAPDALQQPPDLTGEAASAFVTGLLTDEDRLISLVALDNLIPPLDTGSQAA